MIYTNYWICNTDIECTKMAPSTMKVTFEGTELYRAVTANNVRAFEKLAGDVRKRPLFKTISSAAETYLHIAIEMSCNIVIIKGLIEKVRLGQRNVDCKTALELALEKKNPESAVIAQLHQDYLLDCIRDGKVKELEELVLDGWTFWPIKGMPEIETFSEAPMYLSQGVLNVSLTEVNDIYTKKRLKEMAEEAVKYTESVFLKDALGLTLMHKAVLFRDIYSVTTLVKHKHIATMLSIQDNMGRTVLHYSSCFSEHNDIRILLQDTVDSLSLESINSMVDKTGHTPLDYVHKVAKIDTKKVSNLALALGKVQALTDLFVDATLHPGTFDDHQKHELDLLTKNCDCGALLDVTGRSILHKLVIFGDSDYPLEKINELLAMDKDNLLFKGQDLWGRTPMHYAYMLNHTEAIQILNRKRGTITMELINEVRQMKDHEGMTISDYNIEEEDARVLANNLQESMLLLYRVRPAIILQQRVLKEMLYERTNLDCGVEEMDFDTEREASYIDQLYRDGNGAGKKLVFSMKDVTGSTLSHYAVRLNDETLQNEFTGDDGGEWILKVRDNLGRTPFDFVSCLPEESKFRKCLVSLRNKGRSSSADPSDTSEDADDSTDEERVSGLHRVKKRDMTINKTDHSIDVLRENLNKNDILTGEELLNFVRSKLENLKVSIQVNESQATEYKPRSNTKAAELNLGSKPSPSVRNAKFSAAPGSSQCPGDVTPFDSEYLQKKLGVTLTGALCDISLTRPADPIEYLAHYLYKHAENIKRKVR